MATEKKKKIEENLIDGSEYESSELEKAEYEKNESENAISKKRKWPKVLLVIFVIIIVLVAGAYAYISNKYKLNTIQVTGNEHYTEEKIIDLVTNGKKTDNTFFLYWKNKMEPVENIPFVDKYEFEIVSNDTLTITVYEKAMAGCVMYMDQYVYFDNDGIVLETSSEKLPDVPCIDGLSFESMVVGEALPIKDKTLFQNILTITQLIEKNNLLIDDIRFTSEDKIVLMKDNIKILLGTSVGLEDKLMNLGNILEKLSGKSGSLDMENYDATDGNAIFRENK